MDVWNAWRRRKVGGFTCAGARSVGTSVAATVPLASMHQGMRQRQGIRSLPASSRVRTGSTTMRRGERFKVRSCFRRIRIQETSPFLVQQEGCLPIGIRS
jgi:hypothetical protein